MLLLLLHTVAGHTAPDYASLGQLKAQYARDRKGWADVRHQIMLEFDRQVAANGGRLQGEPLV